MGVYRLRWRRFQRKIKKYYRRARRFLLLRMVWPAMYLLGCLRKIDPKLVVFANELEEEPCDNFRPLMRELESRGYRCVYFGRSRSLSSSRVTHYLRMLRFFFTYARARALFVSDAYTPANGRRPRKGTVYIQLWHGCGAFKKWGYSTANLKWGPGPKTLKWLPLHRHYTYACVSSPVVIPCYAEAFHCDASVIKPWGAPRTDYYFRPGICEKNSEAIRQAFPEIGERRIVLYAPTFRGNSNKAARHDDVLDYHALSHALSENAVLLLKPHPRAKTEIPAPEPGERPFVFDAGALPIEQLLCAADLVISDYSSLIFEYALLGRPMLFYAYDLMDYETSRSFYYPYFEFVPGDLVWDTEDVIAGIRSNLFEDGFDAERVARFRARFMSACDGSSAERILREVGLL
ncbi:MAG: CDP-glycerol glycerophosphotransferase family protein [Oscillospiraceae bacterium]|nr:CDP-glycerol glycerophosphotransferase family protein [Oscillospiraceae bacterium]